MRARSLVRAICFVAVFGVLLIVSPAAAPQAPGVGTDGESMLVPGGTAALLDAAHLPAGIESPRAWLALARALHGRQPVDATGTTVATLEPYLAKAAALGQAGTSRVPALLPHAVWEQAVFGRTVAREDLGFTILRDHRAALLYVGLFSLDADTLGYFADHPSLIASICKGPIGPFAGFAENLTIRSGEVVMAGGAARSLEWEQLVGVPVGDPLRFLPALLARDGVYARLHRIQFAGA